MNSILKSWHVLLLIYILSTASTALAQADFWQ